MATERNSPVEWMEGYSNNRESNFHFLAEFFAFRKRAPHKNLWVKKVR